MTLVRHLDFHLLRVFRSVLSLDMFVLCEAVSIVFLVCAVRPDSLLPCVWALVDNNLFTTGSPA